MEPLILPCLFLWLSLIVGSAAHGLVELSASGPVAGPCLRSATLHCDVSRGANFTTKNFSWVWTRSGEGTTLCEANQAGLLAPTSRHRHGDRQIRCGYEPGARLTLTIQRLWPADGGEYLCRLRSSRGMKSVTSEVKVQECSGEVSTTYLPSEVSCHFHGVYPRGEVHWFRRGENVTSGATAADPARSDLTGAYNVSSVLLTKGGDPDDAYNCSLWIAGDAGGGAYLASALVSAPREAPGSPRKGVAVSAHAAGLGWLLLQAWLLLFLLA